MRNDIFTRIYTTMTLPALIQTNYDFVSFWDCITCKYCWRCGTAYIRTSGGLDNLTIDSVLVLRLWTLSFVVSGHYSKDALCKKTGTKNPVCPQSVITQNRIQIQLLSPPKIASSSDRSFLALASYQRWRPPPSSASYPSFKGLPNVPYGPIDQIFFYQPPLSSKHHVISLRKKV